MQRRQLNETERRDWLRLFRTDKIGPVTFRQLVRRFGSARAALDALPAMARRGGNGSFTAALDKDIDLELTQAQRVGARLIAWCEPDYPDALAAIEDAPPVITVRGHSSLLRRSAVGIVGSRNASINGRKMAEILARELGGNDITVVSGLARGIDASAHEASLATGTVAVVAGGVDVVYPEENRALHERIVETGCILSDMPLGVEPFSKLFPRRNRLISGLSLGIVVVEAALHSGSLITARIALDQGREVFAVPGSPLDPRCTGTNDLIRQGAVLTEKAADILTHIHCMPRMLAEPPANDFEAPQTPFDESALEKVRAQTLECLSPSPISVDELVRQFGLAPSLVLTVLLELELAGRIERQAGHKVALIA
jgi:DNA processing protein